MTNTTNVQVQHMLWGDKTIPVYVTPTGQGTVKILGRVKPERTRLPKIGSTPAAFTSKKHGQGTVTSHLGPRKVQVTYPDGHVRTYTNN